MKTKGKGYNLNKLSRDIKPVPDNGGPSRKLTKKQMAEILRRASEQSPKLKHNIGEK